MTGSDRGGACLLRTRPFLLACLLQTRLCVMARYQDTVVLGMLCYNITFLRILRIIAKGLDSARKI